MKKTVLFLSLIASITTASAQWTEQATGFTSLSRGLSEVHIVDANTVWALAYDGSGGGANVQEFTMTTNGGSNWTPGFVDMGDELLEINNLCPVSATTAYVSALIPDDGNGVVFRTTDGGASWEYLDLAGGFTTSGESFLNGVYFWNANVGVAYGDPANGEFEIYRTTDGGDTWTIVPAANIANPLSGEYGYNSVPVGVGSSLWFPTNKGRLVRTTDMGLTWTAYQAPLTDFGSASQSGNITFSTESNGYLLKTVGSTYTYATTSNGGQTWTTPVAFTGTRRIVKYIPGTTTIVATSQQAPVGTSVSIDNGTSWTDVESDDQRGASDFLNATTGWCAGFNASEIEGGIFKLTGTLGVSNPVATAKFKVFPNPASSTVTISTPEVDSANLSVTDLSGKIVMTKALNGIENTVDISNLSTGAYFFEVSANSKKEVIKILKN